MNNKKILLISAVFPPEPVVSAMISFDISNVLSKSHEVVVLCPKPTRPHGFQFDDKLKYVNFELIHLNSFTCSDSKLFGRFRESFSFGRYCVRYIVENSSKIDCIYLNAWPLFAQYLIVRIANKFKIPSILHVQDIYPESLLNRVTLFKSLLFRILLPIDKYILKNVSTIICISDNMKKLFIDTRDILPAKINVISNWQNEIEFINYRKRTEISNPFTFMYMGNIGLLAGVEFLIKSFNSAQIPNSKLIIGGAGSRKSVCIELVKSLNATNIEFLNVPEGQVPEIQSLANVMLLPVKKNGAMSSIPSKLPAYMFSAKPIIGSLDLGSDTANAIIESGCGIVVEPENETELIKAMKNFEKWGKDVCNEKGNSGFEYAMKHFSKKSNLQKVVSVIERQI